MPGTRNTSRSKTPVVRVDRDIDAMLNDMVLPPEPVRLGGKTYLIRTDMTSAEVREYNRLALSGKDSQAITLLLADGEKADEINAYLDTLPQAKLVRAVHELMFAAGIATRTADGADSGESKAS